MIDRTAEAIEILRKGEGVKVLALPGIVWAGKLAPSVSIAQRRLISAEFHA